MILHEELQIFPTGACIAYISGGFAGGPGQIIGLLDINEEHVICNFKVRSFPEKVNGVFEGFKDFCRKL